MALSARGLSFKALNHANAVYDALLAGREVDPAEMALASRTLAIAAPYGWGKPREVPLDARNGDDARLILTEEQALERLRELAGRHGLALVPAVTASDITERRINESEQDAPGPQAADRIEHST